MMIWIRTILIWVSGRGDEKYFGNARENAKSSNIQRQSHSPSTYKTKLQTQVLLNVNTMPKVGRDRGAWKIAKFWTSVGTLSSPWLCGMDGTRNNHFWKDGVEETKFLQVSRLWIGKDGNTRESRWFAVCCSPTTSQVNFQLTYIHLVRSKRLPQHPFHLQHDSDEPFFHFSIFCLNTFSFSHFATHSHHASFTLLASHSLISVGNFAAFGILHNRSEASKPCQQRAFFL